MRRLMRLVRPLRRQSGPTSPPTTSASKYGNSGGYYRSAYRPLSADQIRDRRFGLRRRGLAADEVEAFLARALANSVTFLPEIDVSETTVSAEDQQGVHHRVFCDRLLDGRQRCVRSWQHPGRCLPHWP